MSDFRDEAKKSAEQTKDYLNRETEKTVANIKQDRFLNDLKNNSK